MGGGKGPRRIHKRIHQKTKGFTKDWQKRHKGIHKGIHNSGTTAGPQRDNSRTTTNSRTTRTTAGQPRQHRDNNGPTAGQPGQQQYFFCRPDVLYNPCVAELGPPARRAAPPPSEAPRGEQGYHGRACAREPGRAWAREPSKAWARECM